MICVWAFLFVRFACSRHLKFSCRITSTSITFLVECFGLFMLEFYPNGSMVIMVYIYIPGTQMTSIFEGQPPKTRPKFQSKQGAPFGFQVYLHLP